MTLQEQINKLSEQVARINKYLQGELSSEKTQRSTSIQLTINDVEMKNEMLMLALAELDMQRETDKTESELAIAELAETVLGGV